MACTSLVPLGIHQQCAMASIAYVEDRRASGRKLGELAYAKAFFKALTGKHRISSNDVRHVDASYDPSARGESTKIDYLRAIDILIETRGESFILPLSWPLAVSMFPGLQNRFLQRRKHREFIQGQRLDRQTISKTQSLNALFYKSKADSTHRLHFCRPGEHKGWLRDWHDDIHGQGLSDGDVYFILRNWWSKFWITSYRNDYTRDH